MIKFETKAFPYSAPIGVDDQGRRKQKMLLLPHPVDIPLDMLLRIQAAAKDEHLTPEGGYAVVVAFNQFVGRNSTRAREVIMQMSTREHFTMMDAYVEHYGMLMMTDEQDKQGGDFSTPEE